MASSQNTQMTLLVIVATVVLLASLFPTCTPASRYNNLRLRSSKQPRTTRGFKASELSTAYSFGKRAPGNVVPETIVPLELFDAPSDQNTVEIFADRMSDSFPLDWFVEEMQTNPALARMLLHKFVDANGDGLLSAEELLRPVSF